MGDLNQYQSAEKVSIVDDDSQAQVINTTPAGSEQALVVRPIPSGTQTVTGTVTLSSNTVTLNTATVTAVQSGTYAVSGTVTNVPSGTQAISSSGLVSSGNSSTTTLAGNGTFTGTAVDTLNYGYVAVLVSSDQNSASNGVQLQFSSDNSNWDDASLFTYTAGGASPNSGQVYSAACRSRYFRTVYTNGSSGQTAFRLQTILRAEFIGSDCISVSDVPYDQLHAQLTKAIIVGKTTGGGGGYVNVKVSPSGAVAVDNSGVTQPVSGTVTLSSNTVTLNTATVTAVQSGSYTIVPSGTQTVTGTVTLSSNTVTLNTATVTAVQSGSYTIVPSGTQTVTGTVTLSSNTVTLNTATVTAVQSGSYTIVPSGTQTVTGTVTLSSNTVTLNTATVTAVQSGSYTIVPSGTQTVTGTVTLNTPTVTAVQSGTYTVAPLADSTSSNSTITTTGVGTTAFALAGYNGVAAVVTGTVTATLAPQFTVDGGTTWSSAQFMNSGGTIVANATATGNYSIANIPPGSSHVRLLSSGTWNSGAATVSFRGTVDNGIEQIHGMGSAGSPLGGVLSVQGVSSGQVLPVNNQPQTSNGLTIFRLLSTASTNSNNVKGSAGQVYGWYISNINASPRFVKFYNKATAPTVGTDTPVMTIVVPGNTSGAGTNVEFSMGIAFATGIGIGITGAVGDSDTTTVAANEVVLNLFYK